MTTHTIQLTADNIAGYPGITATDLVIAIAALVNSRPNLDSSDYGRSGYNAFRADANRVSKDGARARHGIAHALAEIQRGNRSYTPTAMLAAQSGRSVDRIEFYLHDYTGMPGGHNESGQRAAVEARYIAGQYYPVEYRGSCATLLCLWAGYNIYSWGLPRYLRMSRCAGYVGR